jgi:hypothetical protein
MTTAQPSFASSTLICLLRQVRTTRQHGQCLFRMLTRALYHLSWSLLFCRSSFRASELRYFGIFCRQNECRIHVIIRIFRFDLEYALRVCTSTNQIAAAVRVYAALGLHEDAVRLALKVNCLMPWVP